MHVREGARRRGRELKRNEKPFLPALSLSDPACTRPSARSRSRATPKSVFLFFLRSPALAQLVFVCRVCVCARPSARAPHIGRMILPNIFVQARANLFSRGALQRSWKNIFARWTHLRARYAGEDSFFRYIFACVPGSPYYICVWRCGSSGMCGRV